MQARIDNLNTVIVNATSTQERQFLATIFSAKEVAMYCRQLTDATGATIGIALSFDPFDTTVNLDGNADTLINN